MSKYGKFNDVKVVTGWVWSLLYFLAGVAGVLVLACIADQIFGG